MKILRIELRNFKAARSLVLEPKGADLRIYGDNGAGKTTIADAFFWLFFDKDSQNRKDFDIKTIDPQTGEALHNLEHEVSILLDFGDGHATELRKTYKELWVKPRNSPKSEFSGHTTDYRVNGVPVQKGEYDRTVAGICDEKRLRELTDPTHFNVNLSWQDRRKELLSVCGDITDEDVIKANPKLSGLPAILGRHTLDDYKKIITARRKEIASSMQTIPARIDEQSRALATAVEATPIDPQALKDELQALNEQRARIVAGGEIADKTKTLRELEAAAQEIVNDLREKSGKAFEDAQQSLRGVQAELAQAESNAYTLRSQLEADRRAAASIDTELAAKRAEFTRVNAGVFEFDGTDTCATCGQALPAEDVAGTRAKAEGDFNERKASALTRNRAEGIDLKEKATTLATKIARKEAEVAELDKQVADLSAKRDAAQATSVAAQAPPANLDADPALAKNKKAQDILRMQIDELNATAKGALMEVDAQVLEATAKIEEASQGAARVKQREEAQARVAQLKKEEERLGAEIENIDAELFLAEEFIRAKVSMLTGRINSRFRLARFKLFEQQINGGLAECCETVVDGVPYSSLNHGSRLNVGLDIIDTLAEHYKFAPPIFIDNAESVTSILPTSGQQIQLVVSEADKALRIEIHQAQEAATA